MLTLEEGRRRILDAIEPARPESILLCAAAGRYLARAVTAPCDLPPFDNSSMDGYAVVAADLASASELNPVRLEVRGRVAAGQPARCEVERNACVRLFTGSPVPPGADAVLMQEDTRPTPDSNEHILCLDAVKPRENIRFKGEDVRKGKVLLEPGQRLAPAMVGLLAAIGLAEVTVHSRPTVGLLATGSELAEAGRTLEPGMIYESNRVCLAGWVEHSGAVPRMLPLVPDTPDATRDCLRQALTECDIVVTTGGVSVGEFDLVREAFADIGGAMEFWKILIKPGKPFAFGRWQDKFLFGLPGNPVSALVTFLLLVRLALLRWQGAAELDLPGHPGTLSEPLENVGDRPHFFRVRVDRSGQVQSAGTQASHIQSSLAAANGLVEVPPRTSLPTGRIVHVLRLDF